MRPFFVGENPMAKRLRVHDFTVPELNRFRELCNFTDEEIEVFNLKSRNKSNVEICLSLNISERKASYLSTAVIKKIIRII